MATTLYGLDPQTLAQLGLVQVVEPVVQEEIPLQPVKNFPFETTLPSRAASQNALVPTPGGYKLQVQAPPEPPVVGQLTATPEPVTVSPNSFATMIAGGKRIPIVEPPVTVAPEGGFELPTPVVPEEEVEVKRVQPTIQEEAAKKVQETLAVQTLAPEQPNFWENIGLVTKAAEQPPLVTPQEYDQRVAENQAELDREKYQTDLIVQQSKTPDEQILEWIGLQGTGVENLDSQLQGIEEFQQQAPQVPIDKKKLISSGVSKMIEAVDKNNKLPQLASRISGLITGAESYARPSDDGVVKAIVAKAKVDPEIMNLVIADVSKRMTPQIPGLRPLGSLGPLPNLVRI